MSQTGRHERWHDDLCRRYPEIRKLQAGEWPLELAIQVEEIFADQTLGEPERLSKAEQAVVSHYTKGLPAERSQEIDNCVMEAVRLQVEDDFEHWQRDASVA